MFEKARWEGRQRVRNNAGGCKGQESVDTAKEEGGKPAVGTGSCEYLLHFFFFFFEVAASEVLLLPSNRVHAYFCFFVLLGVLICSQLKAFLKTGRMQVNCFFSQFSEVAPCGVFSCIWLWMTVGPVVLWLRWCCPVHFCFSEHWSKSNRIAGDSWTVGFSRPVSRFVKVTFAMCVIGGMCSAIERVVLRSRYEDLFSPA